MNAQIFVKCGARYRPASPVEVCEAASSYVMAQATPQRPSLSSPKAARDFLMHQAGLDYEQFGVIYLDKRHKIVKVEIVSQGTIDGASVYPREILKRVLQEGAAAIIAFHNHPSMDPEPSTADELITQRLKEALALIDVRLIDHIIVGGTRMVSFAERGML